jgi:uncharacterized protein YcbK (DUF882 family)
VAFFENAEFQCRCGRPECDAPRFPSQELLERLTYVRLQLGKPMVVNSGIRCQVANAAAGGTKDSAHLTGEGADIACGDSATRLLLLKYGINAGFIRMGIGKNFVHFDVSRALAPHVCWTYYA